MIKLAIALLIIIAFGVLYHVTADPWAFAAGLLIGITVGVVYCPSIKAWALAKWQQLRSRRYNSTQN